MLLHVTGEINLSCRFAHRKSQLMCLNISLSQGCPAPGLKKLKLNTVDCLNLLHTTHQYLGLVGIFELRNDLLTSGSQARARRLQMKCADGLLHTRLHSYSNYPFNIDLTFQHVGK